jgi:hypothetical protein
MATADRAHRASFYLRAMHKGFEAACRSIDSPRVTSIEVDGTVVELRAIGDMADAVLPALAPRIRTEERSADFVVEIWDSASTGVPPPAPPWDRGDAGRLGAVAGYNDDTHKVVVDPAVGTVTVADLSSRAAVVWAGSGAALPNWWRAAPLRMLFAWIFSAPGRHAVHAGAVGYLGRAALLVGSGGVGKSTLAVSCLVAGMDYVGDDYVLLSSRPEPTAHSLYSMSRLDERSLAMLGLPADRLEGEDKALVDISVVAPSRLRPAMAVDAVVIPRRVDGHDPDLRSISRAAALRALAPSTIFQAPDHGRAAMELMAEVVRRVQAFELVGGSFVNRAPELLCSLLGGEL